MIGINKPSYLTWSEEYTFADDDVIRRPVLYDIFIQELRVFLADYGFVMNVYNSVLIQDLAHRIYNATYAMDRKYKQFENGGHTTMEEFETYLDVLTDEAWNNFVAKWKDVEDFKQGSGHTTILSILPFFVWKYIDIARSPAFLCDDLAEMGNEETPSHSKADPYLQDQQDSVWKYGRKY